MIENVVRCDLVVINQVEFTLFPANVVCHDFMFLGNYSAEERINQQFEVLMLMLDNSLCRCLYYCIQGKVAGLERTSFVPPFHLNCCYPYVVALVL